MKPLFFHLSKALKFIPLSWLIKASAQNIILPFYHVVSNREVIHIKYLYNVKSEKNFEQDLDFFLTHYQPIDYFQLHSIQKNTIKQKKYFFLSFDDGLSEFYDVIAPILKRKGIPAVCFLNSAFIDNKALFFRYKASVLIHQFRNMSVSHNLKNQIILACNQWNVKYDNQFRFLLSINYFQQNFFDTLAHLIDFDFNEYLKKHTPYLSTEQISSLIEQGFLFGAHSIDHPLYAHLNQNEQQIQTQSSINEIVTKFDLDYKLFSFPFTDNGVKKSFFDYIFNPQNSIAEATFGVAGLKHDSCTQNRQRIPIEIAHFTAQEVVYGEYFYYLLKALFNKNTLKRS